MPKIGLIGLTAELYEKKLPEFVKKLPEFTEEIKKLLKTFSEVHCIPVVYNKKQMENAYSKLEKENVDGVILLFLSYSPSLIILPAVKKYKNIPVLIWNTQKLYYINKNFKSSDMLFNHGMHGVQDLTSVFLREGIKFSLITGHYKDREVVNKIKIWVKCAEVKNLLKRAKVGRIGKRFENMGDFAVEDKKITSILGPEIVNIPVKKVEESLKIKKSVVEEEIKKDRKRFKINKNVEEKTHFVVNRIGLSLRKLVKEENLDGIAVNFLSFSGAKGAEVIPFTEISKLITEGLGYGGEGDVLSATSVLILKKLCGDGNFVEMFTTDYKNNRIFFSHMGETNLNMAKNKNTIEIIQKDMSIVKKGLKTLVFKFQMKPGKITIFNIAPEKTSFKFIVSTGKILDMPLFKDIISPHFVLKLDKKIEDFLTEYSLLGGTHHLAMAYGDRREEIKMLSEIMGVEYREI